jgi:hypothetical protein
MKFREKLLILFVAVILSSVGFYLISSPFVGLHAAAKEAQTETEKSYLAKYDLDSSLRISYFDFYSNHSGVLCTPAASK